VSAGRYQRVLGRSALRFRVYVLLGLGVVGPAALLGLAYLARMRELDARLIAGRQYAAGAVAAQLDQELNQALETLQRAASAPRVDLEDANPEPERAALRDPYLHMVFPEGVFMLDGRGRAIAEEPDRGDRTVAPPASSPEVQEVLKSGRPAVTPLVTGEAGSHLYAMVPVRNWRGVVVGISGGVLDVGHRHFTALLRYVRRGPEGRAEIVDATGIVLASTDPATVRKSSGCAGAGRFVAERRAASGLCGDCHAGKGDERAPAILAVAPLSGAPWGVVLEQPAREVLASSGAVPLGVVGLGALMLALGGLFAWGAARSVTRPIEALARAAERIAGGDLTQPIPTTGKDEVGRLGSVLEVMRWSLREMTAAIGRQNETLEKRVVERTAELERVNAQLREREQTLARLYEKVVGAQEDERKRIARELHDDTAQSLAVLVMGLEGATAAVKAGKTPRLDEVKALAVRTIEEIHRLIRDLRPSVLDDLGLLAAIRWYAERQLAERGMSVRCEFEKLDRRLPPAFEAAVFRVCQEAMSNVLRHAQADSVLIQVGPKDGALRIEIEDDGRGFDPAEAAANVERPPFGLMGIRERVEMLGGKVSIESAPGQGTRIEIEVPLPEEA
jgi:signal transduction histidine kinase